MMVTHEVSNLRKIADNRWLFDLRILYANDITSEWRMSGCAAVRLSATKVVVFPPSGYRGGTFKTDSVQMPPVLRHQIAETVAGLIR